MTKFRATCSALASLMLLLAVAPASQAIESIIDITGTQSTTDGACVAPIPFFTTLDCSYNMSNPDGFPVTGWQGPTVGAGYYAVGSSPGVGTAPAPDDGKYAIPLLAGSVIKIEDNGDSDCSNDTIEGNIILSAGVRAFAGGPGERGEETWTDGDIAMPFGPKAVDSGASNGGGCDYVIASAGFPDILIEAAPPNREYPFDVTVDAEGFYQGPSSIPMSTIEITVAFPSGNVGASSTVVRGASYVCNDNTSSDGSQACASDGANFQGTKATLETVLVSISTDGNTDITAGTIFANNESKVFNVGGDPNSWEGSKIKFTGTCANCSNAQLARDDAYTVVLGTQGTVTLDIGANDSDVLGNPAVVVTTPPVNGTVAIDNSGSAAKTITATLSNIPADNNSTFTDTFVYQATANPTPAPPVNGVSSATVTINYEPDLPVVANLLTGTFNAQGVDPTTVAATIDATDPATGNLVGNQPASGGTPVSADAATNGTATSDGQILSFTPSASFVAAGTGVVDYTITDGFDSTQTSSSTWTITLEVTPPTASNAQATSDGSAVDIPVSFTLGIGDAAGHTATGTSADGSCVASAVSLNGTQGAATLTFTPDADFSGDATCNYTITDAAGGTATGVATITVDNTGNIQINLPGGSATGALTILLLMGLPFIRRRRLH